MVSKDGIKRIKKELKQIKEEIEKEKEDIESGKKKGRLTVYNAGPPDNDITRWEVEISGPPATPYEDGTFSLSITFPPDYPMQPPIVTFNTKVYHPNIKSSGGNICFNILKGNWTPAYTMSAVLVSIRALLSSPNPEDPLEREIAEVFVRSVLEYEITAREWTEKYAIPK